MIQNQFFFETLRETGIHFFTGVPDSLLKDICAYMADHSSAENHIITANEGNAVALASGYYLATGKPALVYMQNSGLGNTVNPLTSLTDPEVYGIPMILMVGWRGEPGKKDEPQHIKKGRVTLDLLKTLEIETFILPDNNVASAQTVKTAYERAMETQRPVALVVQNESFEPYKLKPVPQAYSLSRENAIIEITNQLPAEAIVLSTTGKISRELYEYRAKKFAVPPDFYNVGSMGHVSMIAYGVAQQHPTRPVVCLDGDGSILMHMGSMATIGQSELKNFCHVVLNNGAHESVGGQPTLGFKVDLVKVAEACGYPNTFRAESESQLKSQLDAFFQSKGPSLLEVRVQLGSRSDLGRPKTSPKANKESFMKHVLK